MAAIAVVGLEGDPDARVLPAQDLSPLRERPTGLVGADPQLPGAPGDRFRVLGLCRVWRHRFRILGPRRARRRHSGLGSVCHEDIVADGDRARIKPG